MLWDVATTEGIPGDPVTSAVAGIAGVDDQARDAAVEKLLGPRPQDGDGS